MVIISSFYICLLSSIATMLGFILTLFKFKNIDRVGGISLSIAASIMTLISIKELIPTSIKYLYNNISIYKLIIIILIIPLVIYLILKICNKKIDKFDSLYRVGVVNMISLILHNILEGIITYFGSISILNISYKLIIGITLHNVVEGISISIPIYYSAKSRLKAFIFTFISSISELLGSILFILVLKDIINVFIINILMYIVGCLMILICILEIIPKILEYKNRYYILVGVVLSLVILLL